MNNNLDFDNSDIFENIMSVIFEAIVIINENCNIIKWFDTSEKLFAYTEKETINKHFWKLMNIDRDFDKNKEFYPEVVCKDKFNNELIVEMKMKPIIKNNTTFFIISCLDVTEEKKIEQGMNEFYDNISQELEKMVRERTQELSKANELLEEYNYKLNDKVNERTKQLSDLNKTLKQQNEEMLKQLDMARRVQESIIPKENTFPKRKELNFGSYYMAMDGIGGDIYDVIRTGRNGYAFLIGDVTGHGVPAALVTTMVKVSFNTYTHWNISTSEVCNKVNKDIYTLIRDLNYYLTAYYGMINLETGEFTYTNASHHPTILYRKKTKTIEKLDSDGFMIGAFENIDFGQEKVILDEGDRLLMFTDGLIEATNPEGDFYKYDRLINYINNNSELKPKDFVEGLIKDLKRFTQTKTPNDDIAILYIELAQKTPKPETVKELSIK